MLDEPTSTLSSLEDLMKKQLCESSFSKMGIQMFWHASHAAKVK